MLLGYGSKDIVNFLDEKNDLIRNLGLKITTTIEDEQLGTGGALKNAILKNQDNFNKLLCTNCDTWIPDGFKKMSNLEPNTLAVAVSFSRTDASFVHVDKNMILNFFEPNKSNVNNLKYISAGLYNLDINTIAQFKNNKFSLEKDLFPYLAASMNLRANILPCQITDIGITTRYQQFCDTLKQ